jgi:predicted kinase
MTKPKFIMAIGVPASGKSTYWYDLIDEGLNCVHISSDSIREELFDDANDQNNNSEVFAEMLKRTKESLKQGLNVYYDACSINRKRRIALLNELKKFDIDKIAVYFPLPIDIVYLQNESRSRVVPKRVIDNMYKNLQIPIEFEGWDKATVIDDGIDETLAYNKWRFESKLLSELNHDNLFSWLSHNFKQFRQITDMPQDSRWHQFSVSRHTWYVYKYILDNYKPEREQDLLVMVWASLLHDTGKFYTKSFVDKDGNDKRYASYHGHENPSSQIVYEVLSKYDYEIEFIHDVAILCQFHMFLNNSDNHDKLIKQVGQDMYEKLVFFNEADKQAY